MKLVRKRWLEGLVVSIVAGVVVSLIIFLIEPEIRTIIIKMRNNIAILFVHASQYRFQAERCRRDAKRMQSLEEMPEAEAKFKCAHEFYLKSAKAGDVRAMFTVGEMYITGRPGIPQDPRKGFYWLCKALQYGDPAAEGYLEEEECN